MIEVRDTRTCLFTKPSRSRLSNGGVSFSPVLPLFLIVLLITGCHQVEKDLIAGSGVIEATEVLVSARTSGEILTIDVEEGAVVAAGDVIATVDVEKLAVQLDQARAGLEEAVLAEKSAASLIDQAEAQVALTRKIFERIQALHAQGSATQQKYDEAETKYTIARHQLAGAGSQHAAVRARQQQVNETIKLVELQIADSRITAPRAGTILATLAEAGELTAPGRPLVKLGDLSRVWVKIYVSEGDLSYITLDQTVDVLVDGRPDGRFHGRVTWISDRAEFTPKNVQTSEARAALVYAVKVEMDNPDGIFKIGMPVEVILGRRPKPWV
ncbi:efflux RND transporter periplasmic adaptor subunit [bacterium]|nr:efflux RND transporter periplasmic adaptor subunit [candidate division CSSED10-310 bacterium]